MATTPTADDDQAPPWATLPRELWREVLLCCPSDHDLYACLCAARCFHALTPTDLAARFYADATVEGMCAAGDMVGLEYAMVHRSASAPPIDWAACLYDAALLDHREIVQWILRQPDYCPVDVGGWEQARTVVAETDVLLLRALAALALLAAPIAASDDPTDRMRIEDAMRRMEAVWVHAPLYAKDYTIERCSRLGGAWANLVMRFVHAANQAPVDRTGANVCVSQSTAYQQCHVIGDYDGAQRAAEEVVASGLFAVDRLIREGRLDEAVRLATDPSTPAKLPFFDALDSIVRIAEASARVGRIDLLDVLGCLDANGMAALDAIAQGSAQKARTTAFCEATAAGHVHILERLGAPSDLQTLVVLTRPDIVAVAVAGDHVDCVRWLCEHAFPAATAKTWCASRARYVSALSLALLGRRKDMATLILAGVDGEAAARRALDEAVAAGDLRVARYIRAVCPSLLLCPPGVPRSRASCRPTPLVLIPINHA
ncbi:hypothetical protein TW95_gp0300 [Pandoravirus inopinatum]|uniref:Ankyrin repeat protein n=1 Tax=Pandoravirus inopinatum TaxID=1605721 RepID=A0A0B5J0P1_9VIRU|nr:hypothetical protein TW95_gp0300 [Pandoravirus inopinatum]AJF97034.1 hypothetical protein [Pandoravirus inopinatum]